jgi:hypothetical protein
MLLPALYHWSPTDCREEILRVGIQIFSEPVTHSGDHLWPYFCFSPTPSSAWSLSGDTSWMGECESWDLWQFRVGDQDDVRIRSNFGPVIEEVKIYNSIPADRLWYIATREPEVAKKIKSKRKRKARKK